MSLTTEQRGAKYTTDYAVYFKDAEGNYVSPFHDIPTWADEANGIVNMVCEVPRWSNAKMEINTGAPLNPITQDVKKGKPRFVHNCFPHHGYIWNYGAVPQTWENPDAKDDHTGENGDNDPIDICDLSDSIAEVGEIKQVKILGVLAMIDDGETDWKLLGIDVNDPRAESLNDVGDIEKVMRGYLSATVEWFRIYKIPAGKPENRFAFEGQAKDKNFALSIIREARAQWQKLNSGEVVHPKIAPSGTMVGAAPISQEDAKATVAAAPEAAPDAPIDPSVNKWHYITL
ncbi:inorganic pyrophosphatase [Salpingoeca rosetta]|uniref:Inorganic pyrophosphatase n=1 Tax=Salpingoeca rosetta (strain ATCC 50818 / BSB-021) TaxID=946362 RepID=F2UJ62_SALR5|nr:inorganic pyrophosphatase [Salpingoeca rosetta]EGD77010.1 inorganic pyrophosphatase [Salpingoeca rosetta]|eukprot:XP_004990850.1 inorganic pyrophosphatase [Salpingoeca rosetta]